MKNKKVLGAQPFLIDGIQMKSSMEVSCYKKLKETDLEFKYESVKFHLWNGCKLSNVKILSPKHLGRGKYGKSLGIQHRALLDITYTPDFYITKGNYRIFIEVKGMPNDVYPVKKKMFLKLLDEMGKEDNYTYIFIEPHSVFQIVEAIDYIKKL